MTKSTLLLELNQVKKFYTLGDQVIKALNGIEFDIHEGDYIAIMGPSGSGKSTLMQIASLLDNPTEGQVVLRGKDVSQYNEPQLARTRNEEIGFVFQQFNLLAKTSALDNVALPLVYAGVAKEERESRAREILEQVGLGDRLNNTRTQLSGGQQQRVAIARALVNNPAIIFADEPTGNLDTKSGEEVMGILDDLSRKGKTIVMVTHEEDIARHAKRIVRLLDGKIVQDTKQKPKQT